MSEQFDRAFWEEHYRDHAEPHTGAHSGRPGPQLVAEAADLAPGTALDAGCGEGAGAIWLASRGWRVTAVDISTTALRRARERAEAYGGDISSRIDWVAADLADWVPTAEHFDLVSTQYVHLPAASRETLFDRLAAWVAPGGTLLVVGHHPADLRDTTAHGPPPESWITAEQVAAGLDPGQWDIVVAEARPGPATDPHGHASALHDAVLRARRRP